MNIFSNSKFSWHKAPVKLPEGLNEKDTPVFKLEIPISNSWDEKDKRLLIICEHVDSTDLKAKVMCGDYYGEVLSNLLKRAIDYANLTLDAGKVNDFGIAVINFQSFKSYNLDKRRQSTADKYFAKRSEQLMAKLQPTHVLVLGDNAARHVLELEDYREKRGWVHEYERDWGSFVALSTIDPADLISVNAGASADAVMDEDNDDDDEEGGRDLYSKTNLLGQVYRDISNIFTYGHVPDKHGLVYSVAGVAEATKPVLLMDFAKVEKLYEALLSHDGPIALDTETKNLNRIANKLLIMQFSVDDKRGFVVPYEHRQSPFTPVQKKSIRDLTYELLCSPHHDPFSTEEYLIGTNLQYDAVQIRQQLKIPTITRSLFDIQAGDFIFDENIAEVDNYSGTSPKAWSMAAIASRFGSSAFFNVEGFSKADRANMEMSSLEDPTMVKYCAIDVTLPFAVHNLQLARAEAIGYTKFKKMVLGQQSNNSHSFSVMEQKGVSLDLPYLVKMMKKDSPMHKVLDDAKEQLYASEGAVEANRLLSVDRGVDLAEECPWATDDDDEPEVVQIFDVSKNEHKQLLFQDVLALEPVSGMGKQLRASGAPCMALDKIWQTEHREVYEVSLYTTINKISKLISSYIKSFHTKVTESDDGKVDGLLHPSFGCLYVKTGRGNSFKPSLQQTPSRGKLAKFVKRMFALPFGSLKLKTDYSANEIRFAANLSNDKVMAEPFNVARKLRTEMFWADVKGIKDKVEELKKELKTRGDIHIANIYRFFKKWVAKTDPLRDAIKQIVFGCIYGKSDATLGRDLWSQKLLELKETIFEIKKKLKDPEILAKLAEEASVSTKEFVADIKAKLSTALSELDDVMHDKTKMKGRATEIVDKMKQEWKALYKWMDKMMSDARTQLYVEAPHGRRRNLPGMLVPRNDIQAALERRAVNSPVQGFGADVGHTAARLIDLALHRFLRKFKQMKKSSPTVPGSVECAVHDALLQTVKYHLMQATLQITQWCMTTGVTNWFGSYYDNKWLSAPEVETEIGFNEAEMETWDYTQEGLRTCIRHGLQGQFDAGLFPEEVTVDEMFEEAMYMPPEWKEYLDSRFPWFSKPEYA